MDIQEILQIAVDNRASDIHLLVGLPPVLRINGLLMLISKKDALTSEKIQEMIWQITSGEQKEIITVNKELDFSYEIKGRARFRINVYHQKGTMAASFRLLPFEIPKIDDLGLPEICHTFATLRQGFILITGPTGHGKSTTLAAILDEINHTRSEHIVTIEDPIEYVLLPDKSIISQREIHGDTHSWEIALRSCLREDPNVVLIGEMRDYETIAAALTIAETGHLVFATLHTNSAAQTVDRIVDVFPEYSKAQVRMQLSATLEAVFSQRLVPTLKGDRVVAYEVMIATPAVKTAIREGKTHLIDNIIQTSAEMGMVPLEKSLAELVKKGIIGFETAQEYALRPADLARLIRRK